MNISIIEWPAAAKSWLVSGDYASRASPLQFAFHEAWLWPPLRTKHRNQKPGTGAFLLQQLPARKFFPCSIWEGVDEAHDARLPVGRHASPAPRDDLFPAHLAPAVLVEHRTALTVSPRRSSCAAITQPSCTAGWSYITFSTSAGHNFVVGDVELLIQHRRRTAAHDSTDRICPARDWKRSRAGHIAGWDDIVTVMVPIRTARFMPFCTPSR